MAKKLKISRSSAWLFPFAVAVSIAFVFGIKVLNDGKPDANVALAPVVSTSVLPTEPSTPPSGLNINYIPPVSNDDGIRTVSDIDFGSYSLELASFLKLLIGESKASVEDKIHAGFKPDLTSAEIGHTGYSLTKIDAEGGSIVVATTTGFLDDSVKAQQLYVVFKDDVLVTYGMRVKCQRSETPDMWQKNVCP